MRLDHNSFFDREGGGFVLPRPPLKYRLKENLNLSIVDAIENHFTVFGGYSVGVTPVLIPNTEVKSYRADDTALETVWESRSPPKLFVRASHPHGCEALLFAKQK